MFAPDIAGVSSQVLARFQVIGTPRPAGSKLAFNDRTGKARLKEQNEREHVEWRNMVSNAAYDCAQSVGMLDGALGLEITFRFRMPDSRPAAVLAAGRCHKVSQPDTSKLIRSVEDSMQGAGLIKDDARFAVVWASKIEVLTEWTGCDITIRRL